MVTKAESGIQNHRTEFVRETTTGTTPVNSSWNFFSDVIRSFEWAPDAQIEEVRSIGSADVAEFHKGPESHEITVSYDLQQWISSTGDASYDGIARDIDNLLPATHTVIDREDKSSISAGETVNGSTSLDTRIYTVGRGGFISDVTVTGDPGSDQPVIVELTYTFEKVRGYQIDQPSAVTTLEVASSTVSDTTQSVTIEDENAGTTETIALNGTTAQTTVASFSDIDSLSLDSETEGDVTLSESAGDDLAIIYGSTTYNGVEGDLGTTPLGTGSHASAVGTSYETFIGDTVERPMGTDLAYDVNSAEISVGNNLDTLPRNDSYKQRIYVGNRDVSLTATVVGESESHTAILQHLQNAENDVKWTLTGGSLTVNSALLTDVGARTIDAGSANLTLDNTFTGKGITVA